MNNKIVKNGIEYYDYKNPDRFFKKVNEFEKLLEKNNFTGFIYLGTLLGCIRSKDIIAHDDDIDVCYFSDKHSRKAMLNEFENVVRPILEEDGWKVTPIMWDIGVKRKVLMGQYHVMKDNISLDLWIGYFNNEGRLNAPMSIVDAPIYKKDVFPPKIGTIRNFTFNIPNVPELFLKEFYGDGWKVPDTKYKTPVKDSFFQKTMLKVIDQFGWAYYFIAKEQQKYSYQKINYKKIEDMRNHNIVEDIIYFHSPGMGHIKINKIINNLDRNKTKIIGAYGGENALKYNDADLIVTISFPYINKLKEMYPDKTVIFLPEAIDTEYFNSNRRNRKSFKVGYVGRPCKVKRMHLLDKLDYDIATHTEWGSKYFVEGRTLDSVRDFYKSIDCLVLTSQSECMPRVVLEAMSMGIPVVSTDVGCLRMLLEPEWIVPNSSEEDIVKNVNDRLNILKKYPDVRREVGKRNRKHIEEHFGWEQVQQKWDDICNALVVNDYDKIEQIGKEFEDKWNGLYEDYNVTDRVDLLNPVDVNNKEVIEVVKKEAPVRIVNIQIGKRDDRLLRFIQDELNDVVFLNDSCKQIINYRALFGVEHYVGVKEERIDTFKEIIQTKGWIKLEGDLYTRRGIMLRTEVYDGATKKHVCEDVTVNVPFPVVSYLENMFGKGWEKNDDE